MQTCHCFCSVFFLCNNSGSMSDLAKSGMPERSVWFCSLHDLTICNHHIPENQPLFTQTHTSTHTGEHIVLWRLSCAERLVFVLLMWWDEPGSCRVEVRNNRLTEEMQHLNTKYLPSFYTLWCEERTVCVTDLDTNEADHWQSTEYLSVHLVNN